MRVPRVVIVGRPNVGKSSVFNWIANKRLAIVDDQPGVTRDRLSYLVQHEDRFFEMIDTGGMGIEDVDDLTSQIEEQIAIGIDTADVILFVVDTHAGTQQSQLGVVRKRPLRQLGPCCHRRGRPPCRGIPGPSGRPLDEAALRLVLRNAR